MSEKETDTKRVYCLPGITVIETSLYEEIPDGSDVEISFADLLGSDAQLLEYAEHGKEMPR